MDGPVTPECEYCGTTNGPLYGWHADVWCRPCIERYSGALELTGSLDDAPLGRPDDVTYSQPFIIHVP